MRGKIGALVAAVAAAASAAGAASWAKRRRRGADLDHKVSSPSSARDTAPVARGRDETAEVHVPAVEAPASPEPAAAVATVQPTAADDLTAIRGLGKVKVAKLTGMGITTYAQIAAWTDDDIAEVGLAVNTSPGQIKREDWVGQAKALVGS